MLSRYVDQAIQNLPGLQEQSVKLSSALHNVVLKGGRPARKVADALHGTWLGHPVHPVMTDFAIGAWGIGAMFDVLALMRRDQQMQRAGDLMVRVGTWAAVPTIVTGLADFSTIQKPAAPTATLHAALNDVNFVLFLMSIRERKRGNYRRGVTYSLVGAGLMTAAAWLGGHLVYNHKVGVDHSEAKGPEEWTRAIAGNELQDGQPRKVDVEGNPVLLYRYNGRVHAIGARCSHAGGPLEEGSFDGCYVQCPWHDSVIDMRDGSVVHGPATRPQPAFEVREQDGMVDVRLIAS